MVMHPLKRNFVSSKAIVLYLITLSFSNHVDAFSLFAKKELPQSKNILLETNLSAATFSGKKFTGSGVSGDILVPTLTSYGTDTKLSEEYTEPDVTDITTYTVRAGDTLDSVAKLFHISKNTIRWQNDLKPNSPIKVGQQLIILPITGVLYTVQSGDTLGGIAKKYSADTNDIKNFNDINSDKDLKKGMKIIIPDGERQEEKPKETKKKSLFETIKKTLTAPFIRGKWNSRELIVNGYMHPTRFSGIKTQGFHHGWRAIDIGAPIGTPIYASRSGTVAIANKSGWGGGYGKYVLIKHNNGSITMYAHMDTVKVSVGQSVDQGDSIGKVGNTGSSTGPHLHFEIRPPAGKSVVSWFPIPW